MAHAGIFLRAHQGDAVFYHLLQESPNSVTKSCAARELVVPHMAARVIEAVVCRLPAQLIPQENVLQSQTLDRRPQGCSIEMWGET